MKATKLKSNRGKEVVKKYVKAANKPLPKIEVVLKPIDEIKGFLIDDKFVKRVNKKRFKRLDHEICAHVVSVFLETFENKKKRLQIK